MNGQNKKLNPERKIRPGLAWWIYIAKKILAVNAGGKVMKKKPAMRDLRVEALDWPTRRDSNPRPPESESVAISSFATDGNITYKVYHKKNTVAIFITKNILTYESFYKSIIKKSRSKLRLFFRFPVIRLHSF